MIEIKFRGKRVDTGEWVYGSNIHKVILNDTKEELWVIHPKGEPIEHLGDGYIKYRPPVVITESIGQYTGLKDKNGVEIFEGDIVKCTDGADEISELNSDTGIGKIEWLEKYGFWNISNIENGLGDILHNGYVEVIGNIFEHKYLLEGENND